MRRRLVLIAAAAVTTALLVLTLGLFFVLSHRLERDSDTVLKSRAEATLSTLSGSGRNLRVTDGPVDEAVDNSAWVFDATGKEIVAPRASARLRRTARSLARIDRPTYLDTGKQVRLFALPARDGAGRLGTVVVSVSQVPYEHTERIALIAALLLDVIVVCLVAILTHRVVTAALRPVAVMTGQALDWSEHEIGRRFAMGTPRDELTKLAHSLDVLLGRLEANLRHERRLSSEIAHELKTPLARLRGEAELALRRQRSGVELREVLNTVVFETDQLTRTVDALLAVSQRDIDPTEHACYAGAATAAAVADANNRTAGVRVDFNPPHPDVRVGCDIVTLRQALAPLLDNAAKYGVRRATIEIIASDGAVRFIVRDDGPGVSAAEARTIFDPGVRGSAAGSSSGSGLGLTLSRRLAIAAGGDVTAQPGEFGMFELRLPSA
ncbi:MAG TPA: ATP-binding protein [Mycobacteriales bacterium]|jgi:signal transduction histidine kinase|nr:ATP-binding protein [Mycobacteriales bacterium]